VYLIFQRMNTAYGWDSIRWAEVEFRAAGEVLAVSGVERGSAVQQADIPTYTNTVNFTPSAALGTHILGEKYNWSVEVRYLHISNAGLGMYNPGLNTVQVRLGVGRFGSGNNRMAAERRRGPWRSARRRRVVIVLP